MSSLWLEWFLVLFSSHFLLQLLGAETTQKSIPDQNMTYLLDSLIENYDSRLRPNFGGKPVVVTIGFWVLSIDAINVMDMTSYGKSFIYQSLPFVFDALQVQVSSNSIVVVVSPMNANIEEQISKLRAKGLQCAVLRIAEDFEVTDYRMDFFLRQLWHDPRLKHSFHETLALNNEMLEKIWLPDTYFENSKMSKFHRVTTMNKMLSISPAGHIHYNSRVTVTASCAMDLRMFPVDVQKCGINIESYGYSAANVIYQWENRSDNGIAVNKKIRDMPQYNLTTISVASHFTMYVAGNWSGLKATFVFVRRSGYFMIHIYAPCALIVVLSWISFCIPPESTAARIALGITSVLTITTILNMLNNSMPKVSYVKAIDWYLIGCFLFVFGVLLEYTLVLYIDNVHNKKKKQSMMKKAIIEAEQADNCDHKRSHAVNFPTQFPKHRSGHCNQNGIPNGYGPVATNEYGPLFSTQMKGSSRGDSGSIGDGHKKSKHNKLKRCRPRIRWSELIDTDCIDEWARGLFPFLFIAFNVIYFVIFIYLKGEV